MIPAAAPASGKGTNRALGGATALFRVLIFGGANTAMQLRMVSRSLDRLANLTTRF